MNIQLPSIAIGAGIGALITSLIFLLSSPPKMTDTEIKAETKRLANQYLVDGEKTLPETELVGILKINAISYVDEIEGQFELKTKLKDVIHELAADSQIHYSWALKTQVDFARTWQASEKAIEAALRSREDFQKTGRVIASQ